MKRYNSNDYTEIKKLGEGAFGKVYLMENKQTGETVVVKHIMKGVKEDTEDDVRNEVNILRKIQPVCYQYLLCYDYFVDDPNKEYYEIVTEDLSKYETLEHYINTHSYAERVKHIRKVVYDLIEGMKLFHSLKIAHRDIKTANIMIDPLTHAIKYIDFGLGCLGSECKEVALGGTKFYMPPELNFRREIVERNFNNYVRLDYWSLGITILEYILSFKLMGDKYEEYPKKAKEYYLQLLHKHYPSFIRDYRDVYDAILVLLEETPKLRSTPKIMFV